MKPKMILAMSLLTLMVSCRVVPLWGPASTPLPGWRSLVSDLLVEDSAFPAGWARMRDLPQGSLTDPTINHVYRSWWGQAQGKGKAEQAIWRAYSIVDAEDKYTELRQSQFQPRVTPQYDLFVEFAPPTEISFQSQVANEFYLACGWWGVAYCEVVARYRNYVVDMSFELEAEYDGDVTHGLTYPEIEVVVRAMDARFAEAMEEFYPSSP